MKIIKFLILLLYSITAYTQYIADPSFEDTTECPFINEINLASWYSPMNSSPDHFCTCFSPNQVMQFPPFQQKNAIDKDCFIGLLLYHLPSPNYREYLETKLINALDSNKTYCVSIYCIRSTNSNFALNNISIGFRSDSIYQNTTGILVVETFYRFNNEILKDTVNWTKLSLKFIANGTEKFLSIGNFDQEEDLNLYDENSMFVEPYLYDAAYYFFDMITLEECPPEPVEHFSVYPNPSSGGSVYLSNYADTSAIVQLYNSLGQRVAVRELPAETNGMVAFEGLASGVYIAVYQTATGHREEKKVVVLR
jgi:hypothetical protein